MVSNKIQMHRVGVMMMLKMGVSPKKVKEIILEVEGKTRISNIIEYLLEMGKIDNYDYEISLTKNGRPISETSNISQALKYTSPVQGVIKLFLYHKGQYTAFSTETQVQPPSQPQHPPLQIPPHPVEIEASQTQIKQLPNHSKEQEIPSKCCCF